jgi:hypothetical protein
MTEKECALDLLALEWTPVSDTVMGGRSTGRMYREADTLVFEGNLSANEGGGFASVHSSPVAYDLSAYQGLRLRVKCDGRRYALRLRNATESDGIGHQVPLHTEPGDWVILELPFTAFVGMFRGDLLPGVPALDTANIQSISFVIGNKQVGPFCLKIGALTAY